MPLILGRTGVHALTKCLPLNLACPKAISDRREPNPSSNVRFSIQCVQTSDACAQACKVISFAL
jgi:hypothetical protein